MTRAISRIAATSAVFLLRFLSVSNNFTRLNPLVPG